MRSVTCSIITAFFLLGCSTHPADPKITMKPPAYVDEMPTRVNENLASNPGSLFGQGDNPLFADLKAMHVNDVVTVTITEKTAQSSTAKKSNSKESASNLGAGIISAPFGGAVGGAINRVTDKAASIGFEAGSTSSFEGSGTNTRNETFTTTISARIIKVMNNGNYFIEGSRELLLNGEKQLVQISGVIRPYDIDQYNNVDSKYIADAKILYKTEGEIDQSTTKPWGSKMMESIWPF